MACERDASFIHLTIPADNPEPLNLKWCLRSRCWNFVFITLHSLYLVLCFICHCFNRDRTGWVWLHDHGSSALLQAFRRHMRPYKRIYGWFSFMSKNSDNFLPRKRVKMEGSVVRTVKPCPVHLGILRQSTRGIGDLPRAIKLSGPKTNSLAEVWCNRTARLSGSGYESTNPTLMYVHTWPRPYLVEA